MAEAVGKAGNFRASPEVAPITSFLLHPILQDPKFLAAALAVFFSIVLFTGTYQIPPEVTID